MVITLFFVNYRINPLVNRVINRSLWLFSSLLFSLLIWPSDQLADCFSLELWSLPKGRLQRVVILPSSLINNRKVWKNSTPRLLLFYTTPSGGLPKVRLQRAGVLSSLSWFKLTWFKRPLGPIPVLLEHAFNLCLYSLSEADARLPHSDPFGAGRGRLLITYSWSMMGTRTASLNLAPGGGVRQSSSYMEGFSLQSLLPKSYR